MAAMVTFIADRVPLLNERILGIQYRTFVAIILSIFTGWVVNRGPKTASRAFGPATGGVLLLLWVMIFTTIYRYGLRLPDFQLAAFSGEFAVYTFGGFARILAVMTGIEVFANLVPAYEGTPEQKSRKAFSSLVIIMGTTIITMLIVGPIIFELADPTNEHVSVFTQTMDILLPQPLPIIGTLIGIAVLLSASAASAQGLQNLALGLTDRNYIPATLGRRNQFDVADKPVWIEVGLVSISFLLFGTNEETYLAIYAAGVFILLSMTGWAAAKRLIREVREAFTVVKILMILGTVIAAILTTGSTAIIFEERFFEGAWTYFIFVPILYAFFTYTRGQLGAPSPILARFGRLQESLREGFGFGQAGVRSLQQAFSPITVSRERVSVEAAGTNGWGTDLLAPRRVLIPLDGSPFAEEALPAAEAVCKASDARLTILSAMPIDQTTVLTEYESERNQREDYLREISTRLEERGLEVDYRVYPGSVVESAYALVQENGADLIITSTRGGSGAQHWLSGGVARKIINMVEKPVMVIQEAGGNGKLPKFDRILVTLDGSEYAERILPYVKIVAEVFDSEIFLLAVPEVPEPEMYGPMADVVEEMRIQAETGARQYLEGVAARIQIAGKPIHLLVTGSNPARTIFRVSEAENVDVIMMATRGRGGLNRIMMGSVAERVVQHTSRAVFLLPVHETPVPVGEPIA
jgi:nucleotide-binding universal stress UspA family protein